MRTALRRVFPGDAAIDEISEEDLLGDYPALRYNTPDGSFGIDILARLGEPFEFDDLKWEEGNFQGVTIRVATPSQLYRMKKDTHHWKDRIDAQKIKERFGLED